MTRVDASERATRSRRGAEDRVQRCVGRAVEAAERIASEVRVLIDARGHQRMRDLQQDRRGAAEREE